MPDNKINVGLAVIFFMAAVLGYIYNLPYCHFVSQFLCLLFCTGLQRSYIQKKQAKLEIVKAVQSSICITRKQYLFLYLASGITGSILNVAGVFFSLPGYIMFGIDIAMIAIFAVMHCKITPSPHKEEPL